MLGRFASVALTVLLAAPGPAAALDPAAVPDPAAALAGEAPPLSLDDVVRRAMQRNIDARTAALALCRADALVAQARARLLPQLRAQAGYVGLDNDRIVNNRVALGRNQLLASVDLSLPLVDAVGWGALREQQTGQRQAHADARQVRQQVGIRAAQTYLAVLTQARLLEVARHARDTAQAHYDYAKSRFEGEVGNRLDVLRADEELAGSEVQVSGLEVGLKRAQEALGILLDADAPYEVAFSWATLPPLPSRSEADGIAIRQRPDLAQQQLRVQASRQRLGHFWLRFVPLLAFSGGPFYQEPPTLTMPLHGWQLGLSLSLPLYDGGQRYALRHQDWTDVAQAQARLEHAQQLARSEVRLAYVEVERTERAVVLARRGQQSAEQAIELSTAAYSRGSTDNLEVVDAVRRGRDAATAAIVAEDARQQAHLHVLIATGLYPTS